MSNNVYLVDYARSPFTRAHPNKPEVDPFSDTRGDELLSQLINTVLRDEKYRSLDIEELTVGCALPVKDQWSFGGRYPVFQSNLSDSCSTRSVDQQCGSGLAAIRFSALAIAAGQVDVAAAGGYENMSRVPMGPSLFKEGILTVPEVHKPSYDMNIIMNMGLTAEKLSALSGTSRAEQDAFACNSHKKAMAAQAQGFFDGECLALENKKGDIVNIDTCIRPDTTVQKLVGLASVFIEEGVITAGNSSPFTTGAAFAVLMSEQAMLQTGSAPLCRVVTCVDCGIQPELMGMGVVPAIEKALRLSGLSVEQIDAWEINEAFSVVPLYAIKKLNIDPAKVNIKGGALALGHPLGATGIRLAGTMARILTLQKGRYACVAACIGGGQGIAMIIERV